jgi:hypothetical protein
MTIPANPIAEGRIKRPLDRVTGFAISKLVS